MKNLQSFENFSENCADYFKDANDKTPKVGDFIVDEDSNVGKIKSFFMTDHKHSENTCRMVVDFRSHILELNPNSKFEIIEPDESVKKAFEAVQSESLKNVHSFEFFCESFVPKKIAGEREIEAENLGLTVTGLIKKLKPSGLNFELMEIGTRDKHDGNIVGTLSKYDIEDEDAPACFLGASDNFETYPKSINEPTTVLYGNFGTQRTLEIEFSNFTKASEYVNGGGVLKMDEWYNKDPRKNVLIQTTYEKLPEDLKI